jgi:formate dehydrogenase iron-sulfur subunit
VGAAKGYIYLRSEYPHAAATFGRGDRGGAAGGMGDSVLGSGIGFDMELRIGAGAYICGEETSLLESLEGKRGHCARQAADPGAARAVRQADGGEQRAEFRGGAVDFGAWRGKGLCGMWHGAVAGTLPVQLGGNVKRGGLIEWRSA